MAKVSLSISGVSEGMSSEEVRQKLAQLYGKPEQHFEKLCQSLFIMQQPFVLLKDIDQEVADKHEKRLVALGFTCDFGDGGLSLVPTATTTAAAACCPACEQVCGDAETCQHCGVYMQKFLKQKKIDEKLQKQLQSASNSHERIQKFQAEQAEQYKEQARAKQKAKLEKKQKQAEKQAAEESEPDEAVTTSTEDDSEFKAKYKEKPSYVMYAALASTLLIVGGGGYFIHDRITNRYVSDAPQQVAAAPTVVNPQVAAQNVNGNSGNTNGAIATAKDEVVVVEATAFEKWSDRSREKQTLKNQINKLVEEGMLSSASGLVAGKTAPRDQVYGRQELLKIEGENKDTDRKMLSSYMLVLSLEDDAERVSATLNQSSIYRTFDRHEEAVKTYDQAARIAADIEDPEQRILAETAIAEHHIEYGNLEGARLRFQAAKDHIEALDSDLKNAALQYIATSEVTQGLTGDAEVTAEQIADADIREESLQKITGVADKNKVSGVPELAESIISEEKQGTGDELIDDLMKMNERNKKTIKAAGTLLGQ